MKGIDSILFPTDLSNNSRELFKDVIRFADHLEATVQILHVVSPEYEAMDLPVLSSQATRDKVAVAREVIQTFIDATIDQLAEELEHPANINIDIELGAPTNAILTITDRDEIDMVIMGTEGVYSQWEKWFGSVTSEVVARCKAHVIVVPVSADLHEVDRLAFATDLQESDPYKIWEVLQHLNGIARSLQVVHVSESDDPDKPMSLNDLKKFISDQPIQLPIEFYELHGADLTEVLNDFAEEQSLDLLVMPSPHRNLFQRLFHKSETRKMALYTRTPVWVMRD